MRLYDKAAPAIIYIGCAMALREQGKLNESLLCLDAVLKQEPDNQLALKQKTITLEKNKK